jgi:hypothetical protein
MDEQTQLRDAAATVTLHRMHCQQADSVLQVDKSNEVVPGQEYRWDPTYYQYYYSQVRSRSPSSSSPSRSGQHPDTLSFGSGRSIPG